ncbi:pitrilysin family protein [Deferribacter thermophilus]|uniref:M16 family metallopeptidase n=1 Tax=Deferribacter thermophilus TaxID=53573 RepID=UPI003C1E964B
MLKKISIVLLIMIIFNIAYAGGEKVLLSNGSVFIENRRGDIPTFSLVIMIKGGQFLENEENSGIGNIALNSWVKSSELLKFVEDIGGSLHANNSSDFAEISLSIPSKYLNDITPLFKKLLFDRKIDPKIFENEKRITIMRIQTILDRPDEYAIKRFMKETYEGFAYSKDLIGELETVKNFTLDDVYGYLDRLFSGSNMVVSAAGYFDKKQLTPIKKIIEEIPTGEKLKIECKNSGLTKTKRVELTHKNIKQAKLFLGFDAPRASSQDYIKVKLLSDILGGGMSSVFFNILRKDKGYAYSVGSFYPSRLCNSRFVNYIGLNYENVDDAIKTFLNVGKEPDKYINENDVLKAKNYLMGRILNEAQTNYKQAWYAAFFEILGLGHDFFDKYIENLEDVSLKDIIDVSKRYISGNYTVVILKPEAH